jgi:PAS domain S-box-containing protein
MSYKGKPIAVGFARDLRFEKQLMANIEQLDMQLDAQSRLNTSILNFLPFPVRVSDADLNWTFVNNAAEALFGIKREEMLGKPCSHNKFCICGNEDCCLERAKRGLMQTLFDHEGSSYQVDVTIFKNAAGEPLGYIEMIHDVTEAASTARHQADAEKRIIQNQAAGLSVQVGEKTREVQSLQSAIISTVADLVEFRDRSTGGHVLRTQLYMKALIEGLLLRGFYRDEISSWNINHVLSSAPLHDMGKIAISDTILNKPAKLTPKEFEIMKTHVQVGVEAIDRILSKTKEKHFLRHARNIVGTHHENWDGTGYSNGLKGEDIPLEGRIMAVADVYDALVSERPYKEPYSHEDAVKIIEEGAWTRFDPLVVEVFRDVKNQFKAISSKSHTNPF